jgi:hypothetical protein
MIRRPALWRALSALFTVINLVGLGWAVAEAEGPHAAAHVALALLGMYGMWRFSARTGREDESIAELGELRLEQLQQSVDAVALEVERIGEAQRFNAKLQAEQGAKEQSVARSE